MAKKIEDIANALDLSVATISRALNRNTKDLVRKETRDRILEYVKKTGYKPNIKARALAKGKLTNLFLIISQRTESIFYDYYYSNIIKGIHNTIVGTDYSLVILPLENDYTEDQIYRVLFNHETAGLIITPYCENLEFPLKTLEKYDFPIVSLDYEVAGANIYNIVMDHKNAGYMAASFLWDKGYRNILLVSDSLRATHSVMRKEGFYEFFNEKNSDGYTLNEISVPLTYVSTDEVVEEVLRIGNYPLGIFSITDEIAVGLISCLKGMGISCPKDVGVLGFDGLPFGELVIPRLSSVAFSFQEVGQMAAETILDGMSDKSARTKRVLKAHITDGESC